jgi:hypothetical protein
MGLRGQFCGAAIIEETDSPACFIDFMLFLTRGRVATMTKELKKDNRGEPFHAQK